MSTSSSLDNVIVRFKECEVERRASYYRYRQVQLVRLQNVILACKDELAAALTQDIGKSPYEAELEISLTLKTLLEQCKSAEFASLSERKKTLRNGGFTALPIGSGLIIGHDASPIYSTISALGAAILAGNIALCVMPADCESTLEILKRSLQPKLDHDAYGIIGNTKDALATLLKYPFGFYVVSSKDVQFRKSIADAAQKREGEVFYLPKRHPSKAHNICLITTATPAAELPKVAKLIARAKLFAVSGKSLGALSFVAVHESLHDRLSRHLVEAYRELANSGAVGGTQQTKIGSGKDVAAPDANSLRGLHFVYGNLGSPSIVEKVPVNSTLLHGSVLPSTLCLVPYTSTEEALKLLNETLGDILSVFGSPLECDYYQTEARPNRMIANDWPLEFLVGLAITDKTNSAGNNWPREPFEVCTKVTPPVIGEQDIMPPLASWQKTALQVLWFSGNLQPLKLTRKPHADKVKRIFFLQGYHFAMNLMKGSGAVLAGILGLLAYRKYFVRH